MNDSVPIVNTDISLYPLRQDVEPPVIVAKTLGRDLAIGEAPDLD